MNACGPIVKQMEICNTSTASKQSFVAFKSRQWRHKDLPQGGILPPELVRMALQSETLRQP